MADGWELVERRGDGKWYALSRQFGPSAYADYATWMRFNPHRVVALRPVALGDPPLHAATHWTVDTKEGEADVADRISQAKQDGQMMAAALYVLIGSPA